jgi:hypothetical protein
MSHIGAEIKLFKRFLSLRGGLYQGYLAGGAGIDLPILKVDFATYEEEMAATVGEMGDRRYLLKIAFEI